MSKKIHGEWEDIGDIRAAFFPDGIEPPDFPTEGEIVWACYGCPGYEGSALVVYERGGKVYEVNGGHCSCYGLEGQWEPEETSWAALMMRDFKYTDFDTEAVAAFHMLVGAKTEGRTA